MSLCMLTWGGSAHATSTPSSPVVEIWSSSLALIAPAAPTLTPAIVDDIAAMVRAWFIDTRSYINNTETLDFVKLNLVDITTGHQITDPTLEHLFPSPANGTGSNDHPLTCCYRVSLDNGTRNPKTRGGFFSPRTSAAIGPEGRWNASAQGEMLDSGAALITNIKNYATLDFTPAVWSRKDHSATPVSRVRVSDVPDDISRRKSALKSNFLVHAV